MATEDVQLVTASRPASGRWISRIAAWIGLSFAALIGVTMVMPLAPWAHPALGCCSAPLVAILMPVLDHALLRGGSYARHLIIGRCALLLIVLAASFGGSVLLGIGGERAAFAEVFGTYPSPTVRDLSGERSYAGMFDRDDILLRFVTDAATLDSLINGKEFVRDEAKVAALKLGKVTWDAFCNEALVSPSGKYGAWGPSRPMSQPVLYRKHETWSQDDWWGITAILFDASTGETFLHRQGGN